MSWGDYSVEFRMWGMNMNRASVWLLSFLKKPLLGADMTEKYTVPSSEILKFSIVW